MEVPSSLTDWSYEQVIKLVMEDDGEPGVYDFKAALNFDRKARGDQLKSRADLSDRERQRELDKAQQEHGESILRTACGMANTDGGFIIFGVSDQGSVPTPQERIVGIPLRGEERKEFGQKIKVIQRSVSFDVLALEFPNVEPSRGFFVVHIPLSPLRPHMVELSDNKQFYLRGQGGHAVQMGFYEVRDQMLYTEDRRRKVTMLRLVIAQYRNQVKKLNETPPVRPLLHIPVHFDTRAFTMIVADICSLLPSSELDGLLKNLLEIPVQANLVQESIQRLELSAAQGRAATLDQYCYGCEVQLTRLFGSLGLENIQPAWHPDGK